MSPPRRHSIAIRPEHIPEVVVPKESDRARRARYARVAEMVGSWITEDACAEADRLLDSIAPKSQPSIAKLRRFVDEIRLRAGVRPPEAQRTNRLDLRYDEAMHRAAFRFLRREKPSALKVLVHLDSTRTRKYPLGQYLLAGRYHETMMTAEGRGLCEGVLVEAEWRRKTLTRAGQTRFTRAYRITDFGVRVLRLWKKGRRA